MKTGVLSTGTPTNKERLLAAYAAYNRQDSEALAAIEKLVPGELRALVNWIEEYAAAIGASETLFGMYDAEEEQSGAESQAR